MRSALVKYIQMVLALFILLFSGCNSDSGNRQAPYLMGQKQSTTAPSKPITKIEEHIALTAMEAKHQETLTSIAAEKETTLKRLELEKSKSADQTRQRIIASENQRKIAIEKERQRSEIILEKERSALYQQYLIAGVILFMLLIGLIYLIHRRNQHLKLKLHEDELRHQEYMLSSRQHHERIGKTLEILADQSTDKTLKEGLVKLLEYQGIKDSQ